MANELIPIDDNGFVIDNYATLELISKKILDSGISKCGNTVQIALIIVRGRSLGLDPFNSVQNIFIVNNQTAIRGDLAMALVERSGLLADKDHEYSGDGMERKCVVTVERKGRKPKSWSFSMQEAKQAGLLDKKGGWHTFPDSMLYYRALGFALRREFSEVMFGMHLFEEFDSIQEPQQPEKKKEGKPLAEVFAEEEKPQEEEKLVPEKPPRDPFPVQPPLDGESPQGQLLARAQADGIDEQTLLRIIERLKHEAVERIAELPEAKAKLFLMNWGQIRNYAKAFYPEIWGKK
jgi:hypothetical protein